MEAKGRERRHGYEAGNFRSCIIGSIGSVSVTQEHWAGWRRYQPGGERLYRQLHRMQRALFHTQRRLYKERVNKLTFFCQDTIICISNMKERLGNLLWTKTKYQEY